jgi:predicted nucleotidyltransferase component of viral defense system
MPKEVISKKTQSTLEILRKADLLKDFYLVGGTALALQYQHRLSLDLDFFTKKDIDTKELLGKIKNLGSFSLEKEAENTLTGILNQTKVTFLSYDYPILFSSKNILGIKVADIRDIACMKLTAISSRGTKRDFVDLFFICQDIPLKKLLSLFQKKYRQINYNLIHILKSLVYFEDAENEPMPYMIKQISWQEIKEFFIKEVKNIKF